MKRLFDIVFSGVMLLLFSPLFLLIALAVIVDSRGGIFFGQIRVGKNDVPFRMWKFRTMRPQSEQSGQLTVGSSDRRITRVGYFLRKLKVDELPQLWNVFKGDMSVVGPRPEVPRYVALYTAEQRRVLSIRPGITDYASLKYFSESDLLATSANPEQTYINEIMPAKLKLNLEYVSNSSLLEDVRIIVLTGLRVLGVGKDSSK
ncbi:MAG: sugar transferase [Flavobacteriales bacterium]|jgi:lipopolysaccharide/colanic/teichoic acid biosynthesis glycosyltransferase